MIKFIKGNIFESKAHTLVNTVNCVGVMGRGLAKEFKIRFPKMAKEYFKACKRGELRSGRPFLYEDLMNNVLCFPTKDNWKGPSKYEFIEAGLKTVAENYERWGLRSIAFPPLGCGLGGLDWQRVKSLIVKYLGKLPIEIEVYEPLDDPSVRMAPKGQPKVMGRVKLTPTLVYIGEIIRLATDRLPKEIPLGRLLLQKLAFFAQVAGVPIKLKFDRYKYGPYDHNLQHVVDRLEGLYIRDYSVTFKRADLRMLDEKEWESSIKPFENELSPAMREKIISAIDLVSKHSSLEETELFSTVLFAWCAVVSSGEVGTADEIYDFIQSWKPNKFKKERIVEVNKQLNGNGWFCFECNKPPENASLEKAVFA